MRDFVATVFCGYGSAMHNASEGDYDKDVLGLSIQAPDRYIR